MFKFLKKKSAAFTSSTTTEIIEQIHREFYTASDRLLNEANEILASTDNSSLEKGERLMKLGFKNARQSVEAQEAMDIASKRKVLADTIQHFSTYYPSNKFITEEEVAKICRKYSLVMAGVDRYKGFVPEKNLREIESFKLRAEDELYTLYYPGMTGMFGSHSRIVDYKEAMIYIGQEAKRSHISPFESLGSSLIQSDLSPYARKNGLSFQICAPIKDMNTEGMRLEGYKLEKHIPDPVVLQAVSGGYLIVTAWGDEASDPIIVNGANN